MVKRFRANPSSAVQHERRLQNRVTVTADVHDVAEFAKAELSIEESPLPAAGWCVKL